MLKKVVYSLEGFEFIGVLATLAAGVIFFHYGAALDRLMGQENYHWRMFAVIVGIYARFIPYAIAFGALVVFGVSLRMRRRSKDALKQFVYGLRIFLAYCLLLIVFRVVNFYVPVLHPGIDDAVIQRIDAFIFGNQVSYLLQPMASHWLTDLLTGAYVSWFWLLFATIALMLVKRREAASEYLLATLLAFYVGYVCYVFVPVIGPGYTLHYAVQLGDIAPTFTLSRLQISRDCFPSLHTATTVLMVIYVARFARKWLLAYIPMAVLIIFATLYLRIHYGTDDLAGMLLAVLVSMVTPRLHGWWEVRRRMALPYKHDESQDIARLTT
ncbi:phosphatase PAP2 family protein [Alicyclobacillus fastidiosus]|uniref:Phosphatase PAP2 family protein n=1 Tax=Alicyclobacillus fastidiosus TaxID=392011 RepID=A0ABY6ZNW2_9BACL|nr:phosphatase PAP2 family protein [Alicyclobacillus fastidiosus]WAH44521.1 phosphatase PAP2 family protein [Alicyclobacillus fastidiosus]